MPGVASLSRFTADRYGPATSAGIAPSNSEKACPSFTAPPRSSPSVANACSTPRVATSSAVARDSRLAAAAVRAACRTGSPTSRLVRRTTPVGSTGRSGRP